MAQRTKADFKATKDSRFADNTTGQITEGDSRDMYEDVADSSMFIEDNFIDEDDFSSDSATKAPSQQSVKAYINSGAGAVNNTDLKYFEQDDFVSGGNGNLTASVSGAGASVAASTTLTNTTENALGVLRLQTGTTTTGRAALFQSTDQFIFGIAAARHRFRAALSAVSDGTDTYTMWIGFADTPTVSGECVDGVFFRYTHSVNSGKIQAVCRAASTETTADTGITPVADTFNIFEISANQAGNSVSFSINGSVVATITTNIPTGSNFTTICYKIEKSAGTNSRLLYLDYYDLLITRSSAR